MDATIDLNADLGEGITDDVALLRVVTSANVACGFHAGDATTMRRVCEIAVERGVAIGAQVSYRDREGFGRRRMDVDHDELAAHVAEQITMLAEHARAAGGTVAYLKPHGALYNRIVRDVEQADAVVAGLLLASRDPLPILGLPGSALHAAAEDVGLPTVAEAFADRAYAADGTLVPRGEAGAVLTDHEAVVVRSVAIALGIEIADIAGARLKIGARSLCVHGDTPGAADLAARVRRGLEGAGVDVRTFVGAAAAGL